MVIDQTLTFQQIMHSKPEYEMDHDKPTSHDQSSNNSANDQPSNHAEVDHKDVIIAESKEKLRSMKTLLKSQQSIMKIHEDNMRDEREQFERERKNLQALYEQALELDKLHEIINEQTQLVQRSSDLRQETTADSDDQRKANGKTRNARKRR